MWIFEVWPSCQWFMADQSVHLSYILHQTSSCTMNHCLGLIWGLNSLIIKTEKHPVFDRFKLHNFSSGLFRTSSVLLFICPNFKTEVCQRRCGRRDEIWVFPPESETKYLKILLFGDKRMEKVHINYRTFLGNTFTFVPSEDSTKQTHTLRETRQQEVTSFFHWLAVLLLRTKPSSRAQKRHF